MAIGKPELTTEIGTIVRKIRASRHQGLEDHRTYLQDEFYRHFTLRGVEPKPSLQQFEDVWPTIDKVLTGTTAGAFEHRFVYRGQPVELRIRIPLYDDLNGYYSAAYLLTPASEKTSSEHLAAKGKPADRAAVYGFRFADNTTAHLAEAVQAGELAVPAAEYDTFTAEFLAAVVAANDALRTPSAHGRWTHTAITDDQLRHFALDPVALRSIGSRHRKRKLPSNYQAAQTLSTPYS
ncbi:hypothetical protein JK358_22140 [Nocardia sp. 2]|uniref:Uncharacterized protein n=1 Tax=Nocardia acididurans TaxID=2802282 RepID=A0ABS1M8Y9_9NOCA|nr:hypothetical protein [Nocardia acididurans]MBL1077103.1 hypothetical protein [Nocardia acididurans]